MVRRAKVLKTMRAGPWSGVSTAQTTGAAATVRGCPDPLHPGLLSGGRRGRIVPVLLPNSSPWKRR